MLSGEECGRPWPYATGRFLPFPSFLPFYIIDEGRTRLDPCFIFRVPCRPMIAENCKHQHSSAPAPNPNLGLLAVLKRDCNRGYDNPY